MSIGRGSGKSQCKGAGIGVGAGKSIGPGISIGIWYMSKYKYTYRARCRYKHRARYRYKCRYRYGNAHTCFQPVTPKRAEVLLKGAHSRWPHHEQDVQPYVWPYVGLPWGGHSEWPGGRGRCLTRSGF